jgi:hypothetical protein
MSKKFLCMMLAAISLAAAAGAQNLSDNEFRKNGADLERQANEALTSGDYDGAAKLANLASIEYRKSRDFAAIQLLKFRAATAINLAQQNITDRENVARIKKDYAAEIAAAKALLKEARDLFAAEKWEESRAKALAAIDALRAIKAEQAVEPSAPLGIALPRFYTVVRRPSNTDCFWNIAKMPEVYGNPFLWSKLWKANKEKLRDPENPNLIYPGMIVEIPALADEKREGTYDPSITYPTPGK